MKITTKKLVTVVLLALAVLCFAFGTMSKTTTETGFKGTYLSNTFVAFADEDDSVLGETKYNVSTDKKWMLIVTELKSTDLVYEVGYDFGSTYTVQEGVDVAKTDEYYTSISTADDTVWTAANIFGGEATEDTAMIVWEVSYDNTNTYSYKAYAKLGMISEGKLYPTNPETIIESETAKTTPAEVYTVTYYDEDKATVLYTETVNYQANATYNVVPTKDATGEVLFVEFAGWVTADGQPADLSNVTENLMVYASYTEYGYNGVYANWANSMSVAKNWSAALSVSNEQSYSAEQSSLKVAQSTADWGNGLMLNIDKLYAAFDIEGVESIELTFKYYVTANNGNKYFAVGCQDGAKSQAIGSLNTWNTATFIFTKADITKPKTFIIGLSGNGTMSWQASGTTSTYYLGNIEYKINIFKATGIYADWSTDISLASSMFESAPAVSTEQVYGTETSSLKASSSGWANGIGLNVNKIVSDWLARENVTSVTLTFRYYVAANNGNKYFVAGNQGKAKSQAIGALNTWNTATFTFVASDITSPGGFVVGFSGNATMDWQGTNTTSTFYLGNVEYKINLLELNGVYADWSKDSSLVKSIFATPSVSTEQVYNNEAKSIKAVVSSAGWGSAFVLNVDTIVAWLNTGKVASVTLTFNYYVVENTGHNYFTAGCQGASVGNKIGELNTWNTVALTIDMSNITKQNTFMVGLSQNVKNDWNSSACTSTYYVGNIYYTLNLA